MKEVRIGRPLLLVAGSVYEVTMLELDVIHAVDVPIHLRQVENVERLRRDIRL
jgi:hypothetical protein